MAGSKERVVQITRNYDGLTKFVTTVELGVETAEIELHVAWWTNDCSGNVRIGGQKVRFRVENRTVYPEDLPEKIKRAIRAHIDFARRYFHGNYG